MQRGALILAPNITASWDASNRHIGLIIKMALLIEV